MLDESSDEIDKTYDISDSHDNNIKNGTTDKDGSYQYLITKMRITSTTKIIKVIL